LKNIQRSQLFELLRCFLIFSYCKKGQFPLTFSNKILVQFNRRSAGHWIPLWATDKFLNEFNTKIQKSFSPKFSVWMQNKKTSFYYFFQTNLATSIRTFATLNPQNAKRDAMDKANKRLKNEDDRTSNKPWSFDPSQTFKSELIVCTDICNMNTNLE
jgi:hypothetical protein